jgi:dihydrolipoamide dehydrogenase
MVIGEMSQEADLVVIGGGPGGYTAAIRAAELGLNTIMINEMPQLGGVCLHMGCIPSKALLRAAEVIEDAHIAAEFGINFDKPRIQLDQLRNWKSGIVSKLAAGVSGACKSVNVEVMQGRASFVGSRNIRVEGGQLDAPLSIKFKHAILATGSRPVKLPSSIAAESKRIVDSTGALELSEIPKSLLIIGGGYIGLEMGSVYAALGSEVTVAEMMDSLLPGVDKDLVKPLATKLQQQFKAIYLNCKVTKLEEKKDGIEVSFEGGDAPSKITFDKVLVSIGRKPNSDGLGLENTKVQIDKQGFVGIDQQCRTAERRIFAIGDVSGQPMLAHRAMRQGTVAAEVIAGLSSSFDNRAIPAVVFTEPEIAWCGLTETEAKAANVGAETIKFPWSASGKAQMLAGIGGGYTKIIFDPTTAAVLGVGIVGPRAGDLISEAVLAIEMGAVLEDIAVSIHPHPTLSETLADAAALGLRRLARRKHS